MTNEPVPIGRTLAVSAAAHVLLFGTAFAFANYGGGLFRSDPVIVVSLISDDKGGEPTGKIVRRVKELLADPVRTASFSEPVQEQTPPAMADVAALETEPASLERSGQGQASPSGLDSGAGSDDGAADPAAGAAADNHFGYSTAEWQLLQASLERAKTYPRLAQERGIEGTVLVRFRVSPSGSIEQVDVVKSSGARILDEASITTVYRAAPVPYVDGWVEVPMSYVLK